jgi:mercuric ion transport protein
MLQSIRATLRREMTGRNKAGAILAMLTCPCHAVMLVIVLAGTAVGSFLAAIQAYLYLGFTLVFVVGLWLMLRRTTTACEIPQPPAARRARDDHA